MQYSIASDLVLTSRRNSRISASSSGLLRIQSAPVQQMFRLSEIAQTAPSANSSPPKESRNAPGFQVVLARNFLFPLFISVVPALMPVVGLKVLQLSSSNLGLLFTSMGAGSVVGAVFIIPWLRARFSSDCLASLANSLLALVYVFMAFVRQTELFFVVAALAGVGWTLSASELWVAAQRTMPTWARGRLNAMGGGSVPRKSGSGAPAFDQCCPVKRCHPDSTHRRIGRRQKSFGEK
jgi:hypothetical protein